ncbi:hypothetical protein JCM10213v2_009213 [Rhodosporidiobolus nylandii]
MDRRMAKLKADMERLGLTQQQLLDAARRLGPQDDSQINSVFRDNAFEMPVLPFSWLKGRMSYREYNAQFFEPWLVETWINDAAETPFVDKPDHVFSPYLDPFALSCAEQVREAALLHSLMLRKGRDIASGPQARARMDRWLAMTEREREDFLLALWEGEQTSNEELGGYFERVECPELRLSELAHNGGKGMMKLLLDCITVPMGMPDNELPPIPHEGWDRLHRVGSFEPKVPLSMAKRAFVNSAWHSRAKGLFLFCLIWIDTMDGHKLERPTRLVAPPMQMTPETAPGLFGTSSEAFDQATVSLKYCFTEGGDGVKLLCCSKCKKGGRMIWYCSTEHQREHYGIHRFLCGTPVASDPGTTGMYTPDAARHPEKNLEPTSFLLKQQDKPKTARVAYRPDGIPMHMAFGMSEGGSSLSDYKTLEEQWNHCEYGQWENDTTMAFGTDVGSFKIDLRSGAVDFIPLEGVPASRNPFKSRFPFGDISQKNPAEAIKMLKAHLAEFKKEHPEVEGLSDEEEEKKAGKSASVSQPASTPDELAKKLARTKLRGFFA